MTNSGKFMGLNGPVGGSVAGRCVVVRRAPTIAEDSDDVDL